ncbi:MAG: (d)CMP kinase [Anaerolinea sp.]|nr:(d)CMP kinase [Anaerolinea sp.]
MRRRGLRPVTALVLPDPIAIDGPAASGKSTLGEALSARFGYRFLDTGLMYRAVTLAAIRAGVAPVEDACATLLKHLELTLRGEPIAHVYLGPEDVTPLLRDDAVEKNVSKYAALPVVRTAMVRQQRAFALQGRAVLAGRDIGTVVLPEAPLKFYLEASEAARARRRSAQTGEWGREQHHDEAHRDIAVRDEVDSAREASPMRPAGDAIIINTTDMTLDEVVHFVMEKVLCFAG